MIDTKELRVSAANSVRDLALLPSEVLELLDRLEAAEKAWKISDQTVYDLTEKVIPNIRGKLEAAETELAELRSSTKFRTSLIGRTEAERDAMRAKLAEMEQQEPFDADSDVFRSAFEAALKARNWPATRQGDGYRSPSTQIAWRIAFSTVNRLKLYPSPGAKGEAK